MRTFRKKRFNGHGLPVGRQYMTAGIIGKISGESPMVAKTGKKW